MRALALLALAPLLAAAEGTAERAGALLNEIARIRDRSLVCGAAPLCVADRIYYHKGSVDELVALNRGPVEDFIRRGLPEAAAAAVKGIKLAVLYDGKRLVPARTPLYPAAEVDEKLAAVLALLEKRAGS